MMKHYLFLLFLWFGYNQSQAQVLTDWQMENVKGKVKTLTSIDDPSEGKEVKKQIVHFDERGFFTQKKIYIGVRSQIDSTQISYTLLGELQYSAYQKKQRHGVSLKADGANATTFVQKWKDTNKCEFSYSYPDTPEKKGTMQWEFTEDAKLKEAHFLLVNTKDGKTLFQTATSHQYDVKGYEIQFQQKTLEPYGDTQRQTIVNRKFDSFGNVLEKEVYDENGHLYAKIRSTYVYYE